jgi:hypothetical protein
MVKPGVKPMVKPGVKKWGQNSVWSNRGVMTSGQTAGLNAGSNKVVQQRGQTKRSNLEEGAGALPVPLGRRGIERAVDFLHLVKPYGWSNNAAGQILWPVKHAAGKNCCQITWAVTVRACLPPGAVARPTARFDCWVDHRFDQRFDHSFDHSFDTGLTTCLTTALIQV